MPHAGNALRGALGLCLPAEVFAPPRRNEAPSGLADSPRPFVLRSAHLDGRTLAPGEPFSFDIHWFDTRRSRLAEFAAALERIASEGLGPGRGRAAFDGVHAEPHLVPGAAPVATTLTVDFLTPSELKHGGAIASEPRFDILYARARDRVSQLRSAYGDGPLPVDFAAAGARARQVQTVRCELRRAPAARHSSRTGQTHPIGGFVGSAEYRGELGEFIPVLRAAQFTGVGRHCVWGNGAIAIAWNASA